MGLGVDFEEFNRWILMARRALESARGDMEREDYNWACFKAHQASEFAVMDILYGVGKPTRGHSITHLLGALSGIVQIPSDLLDLGKILDKFYVPTRYVDAWSEGVPYEYFTRNYAEMVIKAAERVIGFVEDLWRGLLNDVDVVIIGDFSGPPHRRLLDLNVPPSVEVLAFNIGEILRIVERCYP